MPRCRIDTNFAMAAIRNKKNIIYFKQYFFYYLLLNHFITCYNTPFMGQTTSSVANSNRELKRYDDVDVHIDIYANYYVKNGKYNLEKTYKHDGSLRKLLKFDFRSTTELKDDDCVNDLYDFMADSQFGRIFEITYVGISFSGEVSDGSYSVGHGTMEQVIHKIFSDGRNKITVDLCPEWQNYKHSNAIIKINGLTNNSIKDMIAILSTETARSFHLRAGSGFT
jgi:hypothetical protein